MNWKRPKFTADGILNVSPMWGPYEDKELGSEEWAKCVALHVQSSFTHVKQGGDPTPLCLVLKDVLFAGVDPWFWPEEAEGNPEKWARLVTGETWASIGHLILSRQGAKAWEPFAQALARWEAEHRTHEAQPREGGRFTGVSDTDDGGPRDQESARGIRRRLVKRARAGDSSAAELVEQLAANAITVNQAAIAAGMRQRYFRVPDADDPERIAAAIRKHLTPEQVAALKAAL